MNRVDLYISVNMIETNGEIVQQEKVTRASADDRENVWLDLDRPLFLAAKAHRPQTNAGIS